MKRGFADPRRLPLSLTASTLALAIACRAPRPSTEIAAAVVARDSETLARLIDAGRSVEEGNPSPLVWAARTGNVAAITLLTQAGADLNRPDGVNGWTPLQHAVHKRQTKAAGALLGAGADPNAGPSHGPSALMMAAGRGDQETFDLLIDAGADPGLEVAPGINALWAALGGGAISDITDGPPLGSCFPDIVATLKREAPALRIPKDGATRALRFFAKEGCEALIDASVG